MQVCLTTLQAKLNFNGLLSVSKLLAGLSKQITQQVSINICLLVNKQFAIIFNKQTLRD